MYRIFFAAAFVTVVTSASVLITDRHIIGGAATSIQEHPYQAGLVKLGQLQCGAVVLGPKYLATAAHCILKDASPATYLARVGSSLKHKGGVTHSIVTFIRHPKYTDGKLDFDAAVVKLQTPIGFSHTIQPIPLVPINKEPKAGEMVNVTGWGYVTSSRYPINVLQVVNIPIVSREKCRGPGEETITPNMICAGSNGKTTFVGDSGGPLVNKEKQLVGLVSFSNVVKLLSVPGVYTNIASPAIHEFITKNDPKNHG